MTDKTAVEAMALTPIQQSHKQPRFVLSRFAGSHNVQRHEQDNPRFPVADYAVLYCVRSGA